MLNRALPARLAKAARRGAAAAQSAYNESGQGVIPVIPRADVSPWPDAPMKVLLIEDNAAAARLVAEMLRQAQIGSLELVHEEKVSKALARLRAEHYDVILLDLPMPVGRALNDVERICSAASRAAVVVLSGHDDETVAIHAMRRGAQDYVHKVSMSAAQMARVLRYAVERKRAMESQAELISRFRSVTQSANDAILSANNRGDVIFWNSSAEAIFGYPEAEVMGRPLSLLLPERYLAPYAAQLLSFQNGADMPVASRYIELTARRKDGTEFPVEMSVGMWGHGGELFFTTIVRDITERKRAESKQLRSTDELSALTRRLQVVQEEERTRISLKVHDELGQSLTALKLDLAWVGRRLPHETHAELSQKIAEMTQLVDETIVEVREIATDLRPGLLDHFGLAVAIEWLFKDFTERTGVDCKLIVTPEELAINRDSTTLLFRVAQEAMTNVARHANATTLKIALCQNDGHLQMDIQDNGRGITPAAVGNLKSLGLLGVRERVKGAGGIMKISGGPGRGTLLSVEIPHPAMGA